MHDAVPDAHSTGSLAPDSHRGSAAFSFRSTGQDHGGDQESDDVLARSDGGDRRDDHR